ncbi:MAG: O-antigen ligase family protein [Wenzhouxiangella sp.]
MTTVAAGAAGDRLTVVTGLILATGLGLGLWLPGAMAASYALLGLFGLGLVVSRPKALHQLGTFDRVFLAAVGAWILLWLASWALNGLSDAGHDGLGRVLRLLPIFFILPLIRHRPGLAAWWWRGLMAGAGTAGAYALWFWFSGQVGDYGSRVEGVTNPIYFGSLALALAMMLLGRLFILEQAPAHQRLLLVVCITLALTATALSGVRGAWLAIPLLALVLLVLARRHSALLPGTFRPLGLLAVVAVGGGLLIWLLNGRVSETVDDLATLAREGHSSGAIGLRLAMWQIAFDTWWQQAWLGSGPGAFREALLARIDAGQLAHDDFAHFRHPHSQYLSALYIAGIPGLVAITLMFLLPLLHLLSARLHQQPEQAALAWSGLALLVVLAVMAASESLFERNLGIVAFGLLVTVALGLNPGTSPKAAQAGKRSSSQAAA